MAIPGALRPPFGACAAVGVFNSVQRILYVRLEVFQWLIDGIAALAGHAAVHYHNRFRADVFGKQQHFMVAETVAGAVPPEVLSSRTQCDIADAFLPVPCGLRREPLHNASAWEADKGRLQSRHHFRKINAQPICTAPVGFLRE